MGSGLCGSLDRHSYTIFFFFWRIDLHKSSLSGCVVLTNLTFQFIHHKRRLSLCLATTYLLSHDEEFLQTFIYCRLLSTHIFFFISPNNQTCKIFSIQGMSPYDMSYLTWRSPGSKTLYFLFLFLSFFLQRTWLTNKITVDKVDESDKDIS